MRGGRFFLLMDMDVGVVRQWGCKDSRRGTNVALGRRKRIVMLRFFFPYKVYPDSVSAMLLALRLLFGGLLIWHGVNKIIDFQALLEIFPNPLGVGSRLSLYLVIFAEVFCGAGVVLGAFYRLALIPIIISMGVALLFAHHGQTFVHKELAFIFFVVFILLFMMGAGRYSLDNMTAALLHKSSAADKVMMPEQVTAHQQGSELPTDGEPHQ